MAFVTPSERARSSQRDQGLELSVLTTLYLLQVGNAELLRAAINHGHGGQGGHPFISQALMLISDHVHPVAMILWGSWLGVMGLGWRWA